MIWKSNEVHKERKLFQEIYCMPMNTEKEKKKCRLDSAGKLFTYSSSRKIPCVYRFWAEMKELVDVDMKITLLVFGEDLWLLSEEEHCLHYEVIEVQGIILVEELLVVFVGSGYHFLEVTVAVLSVVCRGYQLTLGSTYRRLENPGLKSSGIKPQLLNVAL